MTQFILVDVMAKNYCPKSKYTLIQIVYSINMSENITLEGFEKLERDSEKAAAYMQTISDFFHWSAPNIDNINVEEIDSIYEDFIKSNEHIVERIKNVSSS